jgi:hypothetical protein
MRTADWLTIALTAISAILIPVLIIVARSSRRAGSIETKLDNLASDERRIWEGIDKRVRWIEERLWGTDPRFPRGPRGGGRP